jgi:hypothetical protein
MTRGHALAYVWCASPVKPRLQKLYAENMCLSKNTGDAVKHSQVDAFSWLNYQLQWLKQIWVPVEDFLINFKTHKQNLKKI